MVVLQQMSFGDTLLPLRSFKATKRLILFPKFQLSLFYDDIWHTCPVLRFSTMPPTLICSHAPDNNPILTHCWDAVFSNQTCCHHGWRCYVFSTLASIDTLSFELDGSNTLPTVLYILCINQQVLLLSIGLYSIPFMESIWNLSQCPEKLTRINMAILQIVSIYLGVVGWMWSGEECKEWGWFSIIGVQYEWSCVAWSVDRC